MANEKPKRFTKTILFATTPAHHARLKKEARRRGISLSALLRLLAALTLLALIGCSGSNPMTDVDADDAGGAVCPRGATRENGECRWPLLEPLCAPDAVLVDGACELRDAGHEDSGTEHPDADADANADAAPPATPLDLCLTSCTGCCMANGTCEVAGIGPIEDAGSGTENIWCGLNGTLCQPCLALTGTVWCAPHYAPGDAGVNGGSCQPLR